LEARGDIAQSQRLGVRST